MLHLGEEEVLRPTHAVFFSGCTARCSFCTAARFAFKTDYGVSVQPEALAHRILERQDQGARSLAFIGGDPVPHLPFIIAVRELLGARLRIPLVLNSNFYVTRQALDLMDGVVDIYLPDLKFGPETPRHDCGVSLGAMPRYWSVLSEVLTRLHRSGKHLIVRHLLMPGHFECCTVPVLTFLADLPNASVSLLTQYHAPAHARGELATLLDPADCIRAEQLGRQLGLRLIR
jgi:putative pyruvate formate lyase activating enzyme